MGLDHIYWLILLRHFKNKVRGTVPYFRYIVFVISIAAIIITIIIIINPIYEGGMGWISFC